MIAGLPSLVLTRPATAQQTHSFQQWMAALRSEAASKGVSAATLDRALTGVAPIPRVLELDSRQPEFKLTFAEYLNIVVSEKRVEQGRRMRTENSALLRAASQRTGVPVRIITALWGTESNFGERQGDFRVVDALATLAYNGRRPQFFRGELIAALRILDQGHIAPEKMFGSWAGAMGQCQFIPSSFLAYAVDGDGDGRRDIWNSRADVFYSAGNYLQKVGWKPGFSWGEETTGQPDASDPRGRRIVTPTRGEGRTFRVTENFRAILRWNNSEFFALAVGLLADRIGD